MSQTHDGVYEFDSLPLKPVEAGTNLLVTGPSIGGAQGLAMQLLGCREEEGLLLVTTTADGTEAIADYEQTGPRYNSSRMAVVDCTENSQDDDTRNIHAVGSPSDLTGIGIAFSSLYEKLYGTGVERVRTGLLTLAPLVMYTDDIQPLYRFLHTVTGRIRTANGLGISVIDPEAQDERTFRALTQPFDGQIQVREEEGRRELRCRGLADQPSGWQPVEQ